MADDEPRDDSGDTNTEIIITEYPAREIHGMCVYVYIRGYNVYIFMLVCVIGTLAQSSNSTNRLTGITTGSAANPLH